MDNTLENSPTDAIAIQSSAGRNCEEEKTDASITNSEAKGDKLESTSNYACTTDSVDEDPKEVDNANLKPCQQEDVHKTVSDKITELETNEADGSVDSDGNDKVKLHDLPNDVESGENNGLDDDEVKTNPAYIPKGGLFYMHDTRAASNDELKIGENARKTRADGKWTHDLYNEKRQTPKSSRELENIYGFNNVSEDKKKLFSIRTNEKPLRKDFNRGVITKPDQFKKNFNRAEDIEEERLLQHSKPKGARTFKRSVPQKYSENGNNVENREEVLNNEFVNLSVTKSTTRRDPRTKNGGGTNNYKKNVIQGLAKKKADAFPTAVIPSPASLVHVPITPTGPNLGSHSSSTTFNVRPRQPTDAVYFDPKSHVQGPPPKPRERRRLQFVPPH